MKNMTKAMLSALTAALLLCLPLTAFAQEGEVTTEEEITTAPTESTDPAGDGESADIPDFLLRENNFISDSYNVSDEIRDYMGVGEGDQIVRIFRIGNLCTWIADKSPEDLPTYFPKMKAMKGLCTLAYAVRHSDGSVSEKRIQQNNEWKDHNPQAGEIPDAIWSDAVIRKVNDRIRTDNVYIFSFDEKYPDATVFLVYYETNLGNYIYFHTPVEFYRTLEAGEYLFPMDVYRGVARELSDYYAKYGNREGGSDNGITQTSVDLSSYDLSSPSFHIDVPERPHTGLYVALGIGGGLALIAAITVPLAVRSKKRRSLSNPG